MDLAAEAYPWMVLLSMAGRIQRPGRRRSRLPRSWPCRRRLGCARTRAPARWVHKLCRASSIPRMCSRIELTNPTRGKEHPVSLVQARTRDLAAKNRKLVSERHDLELLELARARPQRRHRKRTPKQQVRQRHDQEAAGPPAYRRSRLYGREPAPMRPGALTDLRTPRAQGRGCGVHYRRSSSGGPSRVVRSPRAGADVVVIRT
jgi:hypothetical protein